MRVVGRWQRAGARCLAVIGKFGRGVRSRRGLVRIGIGVGQRAALGLRRVHGHLSGWSRESFVGRPRSILSDARGPSTACATRSSRRTAAACPRKGGRRFRSKVQSAVCRSRTWFSMQRHVFSMSSTQPVRKGHRCCAERNLRVRGRCSTSWLAGVNHPAGPHSSGRCRSRRKRRSRTSASF
jgi:hypothetical protein